MSPDPVPSEDLRAGRAYSDLRIRTVAWLLIGFLLALILIALAVAGFISLLENRRPHAVRQTPINQPAIWNERLEQQFPEPRLSPHQADQLHTLRHYETNLLHSYGWADRSAGQARIPIARAMDLLVARGLPLLSGSPSDLGPSSLELIQERARGTNTPSGAVVSPTAPLNPGGDRP